MARDSRSRKVAPALVALGSAAIVAVYATGYVRSEPSEAAILAAATEAARQSLAQAPLVVPTSTATATVTTAATPGASPSTTPAQVAAAPNGSGSTSTAAQAAPTQPRQQAPTPSSPTPTTVNTPTPVRTATPAPTQVTSGQYRDGTYSGSGTSRHGGIDVSVVISGGKIVSAEIARCGTRYPCSYIETLPADIVANQRVTARYISGATDSSRAYMQAVSAALAKAV